MQVAITSDFHLNDREEDRGRYKALDVILKDLRKKNIEHLIIAGDLFDSENYPISKFERILKNFEGINVYVIPGNHDEDLKNSHFSLKNVKVFEISSEVEIGGIIFFFQPYVSERSMDEFLGDIGFKKWILVGHGDFITGDMTFNPYERGLYMPLTERIIESKDPLYVFLGHIHKSTSFLNKVFYPGSPFPIDSSEYGLRSFILFDTEKNQIKRIPIETEKVFLREEMVILPDENFIAEKLEGGLKNILKSFEIHNLKSVVFNLKLYGFCRDRRSVIENIEKILMEAGVGSFEIDGDELLQISSNIDEIKFRIYDVSCKKLKDLKISGEKRELIHKNIIKRIFGS